jgi:hypothetical protein
MLVKQDRGGVSWLDGSADGFWKSFFAAVLLAPFYALMLWLARYSTVPEADLTAVVLIESVSYVGAWLVWPVIASEICRYLDPSMDSRTYIVGCNWSEVWIMLIRLPVVTLGVSALLADGSYAMVSLILMVAILYYRYVIARETLPATTSIAVGLAITDLVVGLLWRTGTDLAVQPWLNVAAGT